MDFRFLECSRILSLGSASRELGLFGLYLQLMLLLLLLLLLPLAACWPPESLGALVFVFGHRAPSHLVLFFRDFQLQPACGKTICIWRCVDCIRKWLPCPCLVPVPVPGMCWHLADADAEAEAEAEAEFALLFTVQRKMEKCVSANKNVLHTNKH